LLLLDFLLLFRDAASLICDLLLHRLALGFLLGLIVLHMLLQFSLQSLNVVNFGLLLLELLLGLLKLAMLIPKPVNLSF